MAFDLSDFVSTLAKHLPAGMHVRFLPPGTVAYYGPDGLAARIDVKDALLRNDLECVTYNILNFVQDSVSIDLRSPWPPASSGLAMPQTLLSATQLRLWYGSESAIDLFIAEYRL
jgi:hypothetical protein